MPHTLPPNNVCRNRISNKLGGLWVLARDEVAVLDRIGLPVGPTLEAPAQLFQAVLQQKRHDLAQTHPVLLGVREPVHPATLDQGATIPVFGGDETGRPVTDRSNDPALLEHRASQSGEGLAFG